MPAKDTSSPVKILRVVTRLNIGGPSRHVDALCSFLNGEKFRTVLVHGCLSSGERQNPVFPKASRCVYLPSLKREIHPWHDLRAFFGILRLVLSEKPHIVHTHMAKAGALARIAGWIAGVPIMIHTYHGHIFDGYFASWKTRMFVWIERFLARCTDCFVAMGKEVGQELAERYFICPPEKIRIFYPGLDLAPYLTSEKYRGQLRKEFRLGEGDLLVAMIGRLSPVKRPQLFVRIADRIVQQRPNIKFLLVGGGEEEEDVLNMIKDKGLQKKILFLGWRSDLPLIYSDVDIVFQCSTDEGTPNVLIEALACAKPVVATRVGSISEVVEDKKAGFLADKEDEEGLIQYLLLLSDDPDLRRRMGNYGREFVRGRFSTEKLVLQTEDLYRQLLTALEKPSR